MNVPNIKHLSHKVMKRTKHHIEKISKVLYERGDPHFVDERKKPELPKEEKSFLEFLSNFWTK